MEFPYDDKVLKHFKNPQNVGKIEDPDGKSTEGSPACGDMVAVYLEIDDQTEEIRDVKFESYGCASNIATGSIITEMAKGKTIEEAKEITWEQASEALGGLPSVKTHCSVLAVDGLREAIKDYEERHGLVKEREPTTEEIVRARLKHVMNPMAGLDIVKTDLIEDFSLEDGIIHVSLDIPENHQFANNLEEEIYDKLEPLWDVKEVHVRFLER